MIGFKKLIPFMARRIKWELIGSTKAVSTVVLVRKSVRLMRSANRGMCMLSIKKPARIAEAVTASVPLMSSNGRLPPDGLQKTNKHRFDVRSETVLFNWKECIFLGWSEPPLRPFPSGFWQNSTLRRPIDAGAVDSKPQVA